MRQRGACMTARNTRRSPSPSLFGYTLSRRGVMKGAIGAAAPGLSLPAGLARAQVELVYYALRDHHVRALHRPHPMPPLEAA